MKYYVFIISLFVLLAGCSSATGSETEQNKKPALSRTDSVASEVPDQQQQAAASPEDTINNYYQALIDKDYDKAKTYLALNPIIQKSPEEQMKEIKELYLNNFFELKEFLITDMKELDDTHKLGHVIGTGTANGKNISDESDVMLTLENGVWLLDITLVLGKEPIQPSSTEDNSISLSDGSLIKQAKGYYLAGKLKNNSGNPVIMGWIDSPVASLITDEGVYNYSFPKGVLQPNQYMDFQFVFDDTKGSIKSLQLLGVLEGNSNNGLPVPGKDAIPITLPLIMDRE